MTSVRIDKWLWAARFFKTRSLATKAIELGRVGVNGQLPVKPSRDIKVGDQLKITTAGGIFNVEVLDLSDERGPASVAQTLYSESDESKEARRVMNEARRFEMPVEVGRQGRPSKRDRRHIIQFRGRE